MTVVLIIKNCNNTNTIIPFISLVMYLIHRINRKSGKILSKPGCPIHHCHLFPISFGKNYLHTYIVSNNGGKIVRTNSEPFFFLSWKKSTNFFQKIQNGREKSKLYCNAKASLEGGLSLLWLRGSEDFFKSIFSRK